MLQYELVGLSGVQCDMDSLNSSPDESEMSAEIRRVGLLSLLGPGFSSEALSLQTTELIATFRHILSHLGPHVQRLAWISE